MSGATSNKNIIRLLISLLILVFVGSFCIMRADAFFSDRTSGEVGVVFKIPGGVIKIRSGNHHTLALTGDGKVYAWGDNDDGQCGTGNKVDVRVPTLIPGLSNVVDIAAAQSFSLALTSDGVIYSWGDNNDYQLGINSTTDRTSPATVNMPSGEFFTDIDAGSNETSASLAIALTDAGNVYTWGHNDSGQCGDGHAGGNNIKVPTRVTSLSNITEVSIGAYAGMAVDRSGTLYTWGYDSSSYAQLGDTTNRGTNQLPANYSGLTNIKSIYCSTNHMAAIDNNGQVYIWGNDNYGTLGKGSSGGSVTTPVVRMSNGKQLALGKYSTLVITDDGSLYTCGSNNMYELGLGTSSAAVTTLTKVTSVSNVTWATAQYDCTSIVMENNVYSAGSNGAHYKYGNGVTATSGNRTYLGGMWTRPAALG
jgi:alpha-tubulin suppressor-like RCC1 family protein